jgi:broad specificity phosphatase PhoE
MAAIERVHLIRHGKPAAAWGEAEEDPGLDDDGRAQAEAVASRLIALPEQHRPRRVVSSPLRRCRETAQPLADLLGVAVEIDAAVGEIPTPRRLSHAERPAWLRGAFAGAWADIQGDIDYDAWRHAVVMALATRGGAAVFSHFVAINAVVSVLNEVDEVICFRPDHTSLTTLETDGDQLALVSLGGEAVTGVL